MNSGAAFSSGLVPGSKQSCLVTLSFTDICGINKFVLALRAFICDFPFSKCDFIPSECLVMELFPLRML